MKKISIGILFTIVFMMTYLVTVNAWNPPTVNSENIEEDSEFRAVWVCTVSNMDISKQNGTSEAAINAWKEEYLTILNSAISMHMNAIIFQVRPCNDAFYPSKYNPWSEYLVGFGVDPGWDPLSWMVEVTHAAGLEYHAWLNPYRVTTSAGISLSDTDNATGISYIYNFDTDAINNYKETYFSELKNIAAANNNLVDNPIFNEGEELYHEVLLGSESKFILNPAASETIEHLENTVNELLTNYDLDGIHFDDYFYPSTMTYKGDDATYKGYTFSCEPNVDMNDYLSSVEEGSTLSIYDWRRQNVDNLIENLSILIRNYNKTSKIKCAFGISPSSHWAPSIESCPVGSERGADGGEDSSCNGYYSYSDLYADTRKWVLEEWIDYILPQNYTYLGSSQSGVPTGTYNKTVAWWSNVVSTTNVKLYMGTAAYQLSSWNTSKLVDFRELYYQMKWNQYKNYNVSGYVMFRYESLLSGTGLKAINYVNSTLWKKDALTPIYDTYTYEHLEENAKIIQIYKHSDTTYSVTFSAVEGAKAYGIFEDDNLIARSLRQEELYFTADSTHTYYLVTYGQDNKIAEKTELIDLACAYTNQAPSFISTPTIDKEYLLGSHITLSFEVNDPENDALTYSLYCYEGNTCYKLVENKTIENNTITYDYECFYTEASNLYFEVIIKDETHEITYKSTSFDLVKQLTSPDEPSDDIVIDDKEENQTPVKAKKCGKKDASIIMLTIFNALSIFTIYYIYRKEK